MSPHAAQPDSHAPRQDSTPIVLRFTVWPDAVLDAQGFGPTHPYSEWAWLPLLGPASTLAWRRVAFLLTHTPAGVTIDAGDLAASLGLGRGTHYNSPILRTLRRLAEFQLINPLNSTDYAARIHIPPLPARLYRKLSPELQQIHASMIGAR
jgi:hypothetical protein